MIIDFHTHIFPDKIAPKTIMQLEQASGITAATDGTLLGLLSSMEQNGVDFSVILPVVTNPSQFESVNLFAAQINRKYEHRLVSFGGIHPDCEDYKAGLDRIRELGLMGIKLHPDYQGVMIDDERYLRIIEYADHLDLIIVVHAGIDIGLPNPVHCPPRLARKVIDTIHPKKMVLAHMGGWKQWDEVYEWIAGTDVYLDTAFSFDYIKPDQFIKIVKKHGYEKILFATDSPWSDAAKDVNILRRTLADHLSGAGAEEAKKAILCDNALDLLNNIPVMTGNEEN